MPELLLEGADAEIVALGLEPTVEERIGAKLLQRYRENDVLVAYFKGEIDLIVDRELLDLTSPGSPNPLLGSKAPALYLALVGSRLRLEPSHRGLLSTEWEVVAVLPSGPTFDGIAGLTRLRLIWLLFGLTLGSDNPGALENDDDPGNPLTSRLAEFGQVAAPSLDRTNATLRTVIGFTFESHVNAISGEV